MARQFEIWDWLLFGATLVISIAIGIYYAINTYRTGKNKASDFLLARGGLHTIPVALSILVSFMSAILILGTPAEMIMAGTQFYMIVVGIILGTILACQVYVPLLHPLKITSSFEYLERRFNSKAAKLTGTFMMIIQQVIYMGIASYAPSTALEAVTGFPTYATIITIGIVSTFYTFLGGMKAVVWTDAFQSLIMIAGLLAIVIQGTIAVGGYDRVWRINDEWRRIEFFDFNPDPTQRHSFWSLAIGGIVGWMANYGLNQASVQRYCALPTLQKAKMAVLLNILGVFFLLTVTCMAGTVAFAYYAQKGCDPYMNGDVSNPNQIIPYFVMDVLRYPGLPGLFVACLFSGALSTMSSSLNALAAVTWEDIISPFLLNISESSKTWITRVLVAFYGGAGMGMSFMAMKLGGTVLQASLSFNGAVTGPLLGIFALGAFFPWANWIGAVIGSICGLILTMWISIGAYSVRRSPNDLEFPLHNCTIKMMNSTLTTFVMTTETTNITANRTTVNALVTEITGGIDALYSVSYLWYPSIGAATVIVVGLIISFLTGPMTVDEVDSKYLIPIFDRLMCCLPNSLLGVLRCNKEFKDPKDIKFEEYDIEFDADSSEGTASPNKVMFCDSLSNGVVVDSVYSMDNPTFKTDLYNIT